MFNQNTACRSKDLATRYTWAKYTSVLMQNEIKKIKNKMCLSGYVYFQFMFSCVYINDKVTTFRPTQLLWHPSLCLLGKILHSAVVSVVVVVVHKKNAKILQVKHAHSNMDEFAVNETFKKESTGVKKV